MCWRRARWGWASSYIDGWWDCDRIDELAHRIFRGHVEEQLKPSWSAVAATLRSRLLNLQSQRRAAPSGGHPYQFRHPYQFGDDLFRATLDRRMVYSCGYWRGAATLDEAQEHKLNLICRKLGLKPGQRVLDIGCGWGSFARFAAENYGVTVVGINLSEDQGRSPARPASTCPSRSATRTTVIWRETATSTTWSRSGCSSTWATRTTASS